VTNNPARVREDAKMRRQCDGLRAPRATSENGQVNIRKRTMNNDELTKNMTRSVTWCRALKNFDVGLAGTVL
jgi:hypothetical protein